MNQPLTLLGIATACFVLQACSSTPPPPIPMPMPATQTPQDEVAPVVVLPPDPTAYEAAQRVRAADLERDGKLAEAALVWEVLSTIRPRNDSYRLRLAELNRKASAAAAERLQRGDKAVAAGQLDAAVSFYLSALALQPDHAKAADALRSAERERIRKNHLGKLSRHTLTRKAMADGDMVPLPSSPAEPPAGAQPSAQPPIASITNPIAERPVQRVSTLDRIEVEHASLLASQGGFDEAITMLERWLQGHRRDDAARQLLADVYVQKAESLADSKPNAAVALLEKSLQIDRNNPRTAERLQQLKASARK